MAEPTVLSAGTFIASVLETAGYMTQARFLDVFESNGFFREAGAFIFTIGAVGAVLSFLMFGSYRGVRYLLVGPAMFWFLVTARSETYGSVWKINGQTPQTPGGASSVQGAIERRNEVIRKATDGWQGAGGDAIKVATGFALFASVTNAVTEDLVKMFMENAPKKDLSNFGKVRGYEILTMVTPEDSLFVEMLEQDFLVQCAPLMNAAIALSAVQLRQVVGGGTPSAAANADANSVSAHYQQIINQHLNTPDKFVGVATKSYILAQLARTDGGSNVSRTVLTDRNQPFPSISCGKYWELVTEYLIAIAKRKEADILRIARIDVEARAAFGENIVDPCAEIRQLIYGERNYAGECDLKWAIALYMLKNQIGPNSSYARMLKRHWNTQEMINPIRNANLTPIPILDNSWKPAQGLDLGPITRTLPVRAGGVVVGYRIEQLFVPGAAPGGMRDPNARPAETDRWVEVVPHVGNQGADHAMWVSTQRAQTVNLRQQMFTYALQLPYWQGMILYLIAATYPFMALLVLIPGRAQSFLNVPMAWIWAKSWDVGLAAVIVLDRVMWNMLMNLTPHRLDRTLNQDAWRPEQLVTVLKEAFKIDPGFNIHMYYMLVSVVMLSIPAIAGAATIKAKRSILASFTEALDGHAKDAGMRAASQFQMEVMNTRYGEMSDSGSVAELRFMSQGNGIAGRGRAAIGLAFGTMDGMTKAANGGLDAIRTANGSGGMARSDGMTSAIRSMPGAVAGGVRTFSAQTVAQARFEKAFVETFDPEVGRWGRIQMIQDAYASAMDGSGGFEIKASTENPAVGAFIDVFADRAVAMLKMVEQGALAGLKSLEIGGPGAKDAEWAAATQAALGIFYLGILHGAADDRNRQAALETGLSTWRGITGYEESNTSFLERAFLLPHEQALALTGERDVPLPVPAIEPHMIPIIDMNEEFRPPRFVDAELAAVEAPRLGPLAMRDADDIGAFVVNFPHQGELTALAFAPEPPEVPEREPRPDRRIAHRFGELPVQLPADIELQIANNPEQADEIIRQYLENSERLAAVELIHEWNQHREESMHHDEQYRFRMAKALRGRSERETHYANVLGKRRKWDDEVDLDDDDVV